MNPFVNYQKRSVELPKGCKNLTDVLRLSSSGARKWKFRVIAISGDRDTVRGIQTENSKTPGELSFLIARLPKGYAVVGLEFDVACTFSELNRLTEDRDW